MQTNGNLTVEADGPQGEGVHAARSGDGADRPLVIAAAADDTLAGWARERKRRGSSAANRLPLLPAAPGANEAAGVADLGAAVARFHHGDTDAGAVLEKPGDHWVPALLHPFRDPDAVRNDYPLFLFAADAGGDARLAAPLADVLREAIDAFAPGADDARILKDNLARLERRILERAVGMLGSDARTMVGEAGEALLAELGIKEANRARLVADLEKLASALPRAGTIVALTEQTPLVLFTHAARRRALQRRSELGREIGRLRHKLDGLLRVDRGKERRRAAVVPGGAVDADALTRVLGPARGAQRMDAERHRRIESVVAEFDRYLASDVFLMTVLADNGAPAGCEAPGVVWRTVEGGAVCASAIETFDAQAREHAKLYAAMRVARLEVAGAYDPERHDALIRDFGRDAFADEELTSLPLVVALESAERLAGPGMVPLSRLLLSGRPVEVLVSVRPAADPMADLEAGFRFEPGYLGLSHREALVHQSSVARPAHLMEGFLRSVAAKRASLHLVAGGLDADGKVPRVGSWLYGGAALEGRAHPFFHYDPEAGESFAKRFDFGGNPDPAEDWPVYEFPCRDAAGADHVLRLAFTFADFALLERGYRDLFRAIPPAVAGEEFVPLDQYLTLGAAAAAERIPFLWSVDGDGNCRRLVPTRSLVAACRDRLRYWHTLQELAGVRNEYVRDAVAAERARLEREFVVERERLAREKELAVAEAECTAAGRAMQKLAETLLSTDLDALVPARSPQAAPTAAASIPPAAEAPTAVATAVVAAVVPDTAQDEGTEEAWIDSVLCTSCNDCTNLNNRLFLYNANKQAVLGDLSAGTYAELVTAAEKCPSRCIHPGKPLHSDEPDLEALVKRAARFN